MYIFEFRSYFIMKLAVVSRNRCYFELINMPKFWNEMKTWQTQKYNIKNMAIQ